MKVFVAGASGAIGASLLPRLAAAGHEVTAMTRHPAKAVALEAHARAVVCDVYDAEQLTEVVRAAAPDVVVHQLTALPQSFSPGDVKAAYAANDRVREEGTANLIAAATAAGAARMVAQSIAFWYRPRGDRSVRHGEDDPMWLDAPEPIGHSASVMRAAEESVLGAPGMDGVVLRYGFFYGPGTWYSRKGSAGHDVARRRQPLVGKGVWSFIHVDDAADATVRALTAPPGIYNVVDDDPAPMAEWVPAFAEALGAPRPLRAPKAVAGLVAGRGPVTWMDSLEGADNSRAKRELRWEPAHPSWRQGFRSL